MEKIWCEKYRPLVFKDIIGQKPIVDKIKAMVEKKNLPHQLYVGPAGVGKTSLILVVSHELYGDSWQENILELNASDTRGIDVIRNEVKNFARTKSLTGVPKICILDEADSLTKEAQQALRRTMEKFSNSCRFCLLANYSSKIIEPIQSRCAVFRFKPLVKEEINKIITNVADNENLKIGNKAIDALFEISEGDVRKIYNILQSCSSISKEITNELIYEMVSFANPKEVKKILENAVSGDFIKSREKLLKLMLEAGLSGTDIIKQVQREIWELDIENDNKLKLIEKCAEIEFRMVEGADEFIQLEALLSQFVLLGK
ncbi:MAG: replication factor C small subunit [Nanoarchaeota archaeon]|nr:replication factor C small subunit [Nanoarchaeota archaeon]MBU0962810.1 replication factor C small subunit [Nanoarchaeota archaeon]